LAVRAESLVLSEELLGSLAQVSPRFMQTQAMAVQDEA